MTSAQKNPGRRSAVNEFFQAAAPLAAFVTALLVMAWVMLVLPGIAVYTITSGERAAATIEHCDKRAPLRDTEYLDCRGTWRFADGSRDSGHVSGVGSADIGHEVPVRIGPLGPYARGFDRSRHLLFPGAFGWATTLPVAGVVWFFVFRGRARGRRILGRLRDEDAGPSWTGRRRWRDDRGRTVLRFRVSSRPPELPTGAVPERPDKEDLVRRRAKHRAFATARVPSGRVAFFVARRPGGFAVFDPSGRLTVVAQSAVHSPPPLTLLAPDRTPLGEITEYSDTEDERGVAFRVTTETGETVAVVVARLLRWTVVFRGDPPEHLRHAVVAFAFDALRLTR